MVTETTNYVEVLRLSMLLAEAQREALRKGWYGEVVVIMKVVDGVIQRSSGVESRRRRA